MLPHFLWDMIDESSNCETLDSINWISKDIQIKMQQTSFLLVISTWTIIISYCLIQVQNINKQICKKIRHGHWHWVQQLSDIETHYINWGSNLFWGDIWLALFCQTFLHGVNHTQTAIFPIDLNIFQFILHQGKPSSFPMDDSIDCFFLNWLQQLQECNKVSLYFHAHCSSSRYGHYWCIMRSPEIFVKCQQIPDFLQKHPYWSQMFLENNCFTTHWIRLSLFSFFLSMIFQLFDTVVMVEWVEME